VDDEPPAIIHLTNRLTAHPEIEIVGEAGSVTSAFALLVTKKPDVIFLDIQMPKKNGFALLPKLESLSPQPAVVFVTAFDDYAIRAFEANALDYLTKPVRAERLAKTISRLIKRESYRPFSSSDKSEQLSMEDLVLLRDGAFSMMVKAWEITAIESDGDYTRILLCDEEGMERKPHMKKTLAEWERQLPSEPFCKVSRSLLVNTKAVSKLIKKNPTSWELHLQGITTPILLSNLESKRLREVLS
jgi:two-component system LytT family response regulator